MAMSAWNTCVYFAAAAAIPGRERGERHLHISSEMETKCRKELVETTVETTAVPLKIMKLVGL